MKIPEKSTTSYVVGERNSGDTEVGRELVKLRIRDYESGKAIMGILSWGAKIVSWS